MKGFIVFVFALLALIFGVIGGYFHDWPKFAPLTITLGLIMALLAGIFADWLDWK